jgi:hypothetical protein
MSNPLAIASVTAVLVRLLENTLAPNAVVNALSTQAKVTALAPDLIDGADAVQLNLFLYHVEPNGGWRNVGQPSRDARGDRVTNPPLALDLYYLLTAYGKESYEADILLGYAMQLLHEWPVLTREVIRGVMDAITSGGGGGAQALEALAGDSDLAEQVELIKITQHSMNSEERSNLWAAVGGNYRPSAVYHASVVLIESEYPGRSPLPVLTRGKADAGVIVAPSLIPPFPTLTAVEPPSQQVGVRLGEVLTVSGFNLKGDSETVIVESPRLPAAFELTPQAGGTETQLRVKLETATPADDPQNWAAGVYTLSVAVTEGGERRLTSELPFTLAPRVTGVGVAGGGGGVVTLTVVCVPDVRPEQRASLVVGSREVQSEARATKTDTLSFVVGNLAPGKYRLRLRVDGAESLLIDRSKKPPAFFPPSSPAAGVTEVTIL